MTFTRDGIDQLIFSLLNVPCVEFPAALAASLALATALLQTPSVTTEVQVFVRGRPDRDRRSPKYRRDTVEIKINHSTPL